MKGIKILVLKGFDIVYVYVKSLVEEWCDILIIYTDNRKVRKYLCKQKHIYFHNYVINIHSFDPKHACDQQSLFRVM
jgi:hypothetical protein